MKTRKTQSESKGAVIVAPFGKVGIQTALYEGSLMLSQIFYAPEHLPLQSPQNLLEEEVIAQIQGYFSNAHRQFELPMIPQGTIYQNTVWQIITQIPAGETSTYGAIAKKIHSAARAIGGACGANPYPLIVPCHRVVAANSLGGFVQNNTAGYHRNIKIWLLQHEGVINKSTKHS